MNINYYKKLIFCYLIFQIQLINSLVIYDSHIASSCIYYLRKRSWNCASIGGHMSSSTWACQCNNIEWLGSITNCIYDYSNSTQELTHGYNHIIKRCNVKVGTNFTIENLEFYQKNATNYLQDSSLFPKGINVTTPLSISVNDFTWWYKTFKDYNNFISMSQRLGWGAVGFWISIIGLAGIYNYNGYRFIPLNLIQLINNHLIYKYDYFFLGFNRLEVLICFLFTVLIILLCSIGYNLELNSYLSNTWFKTLDCLSFRTDIIAFSLMPVLYLMGIRNNPFQYLGLLPHNTMIKFHKFVAIIFFILALIHSVIWTHYARSKDGGGYSVWAADAYFYWGIVGTICVGLMLGFSIELVRNIYYEIFLFFHLSFSVLFIAAMWKHCETLGWMTWVYSMAAILVFDRVCRIFRIFQNGLINKVKIDIYNEYMIKLEFIQPVGLFFYPGSYVYLHFLQPFYFAWQSHPFSLIRSIDSNNKLVIYLKCKKGITKRLSKFIDKDYINVLIDGPYGNFPISTNNDNNFEDVIGIAGGLGIPSILIFFNNRAQNIASMDKYKLFWLINDLTQLDMLKENLEYLAKRGVQVIVYFTKYEKSCNQSEFKTVENSDSVSDTDDIKDDQSINDSEIVSNLITLKYGKPELIEILPQCNNVRRRIYACGPDRLIKSVRKTLSDCDELHVEKHTW